MRPTPKKNVVPCKWRIQYC